MEKKLKILLLEDNSTDAGLIERLLKKSDLDFEFRHAANKKAFLKALEEFPADVILSDNSLPSYSATEAVKLIRQRSIPFISTRADVSSATTTLARMTVKTEVGDSDKIGLIQKLVQEHVQVDRILELIQKDGGSPSHQLHLGV